jgi:hypothetical protein
MFFAEASFCDLARERRAERRKETDCRRHGEAKTIRRGIAGAGGRRVGQVALGILVQTGKIRIWLVESCRDDIVFMDRRKCVWFCLGENSAFGEDPFCACRQLAGRQLLKDIWKNRSAGAFLWQRTSKE